MNENTINDPAIFREIKCGVCKKRVSTQLCDFVTQYNRPIFFSSSSSFRGQNLHGTCDMPLCEDCTTKHNTIYDFCPHHAGLIDKVQLTIEMQKSIGEYVSDEIKRYLEEEEI